MAVIVIVVAILSLFPGIIAWEIKLTNEMSGRETKITPATIVVNQVGAGIFLVLGVIYLVVMLS